MSNSGKNSFGPHPEWGNMLLEDPRSNPASVEVVVKGKTFRGERQYARGTYGPEEVRMTDDQMEKKNQEGGRHPNCKTKRVGYLNS